MSKRKQTSKTLALFIIGTGFLLIVFTIVLSVSQGTQNRQTSPVLSEEEQDALVPRISLNKAKSALDSGSALFLDVRTAEAFQTEHITGAINIPLAELESRISELDPAQWIITYCT